MTFRAPNTKADVSYFMPLSNGASASDGPSKSVFSVPPFNYSPETQHLVQTLMKESRLTFTQRNGFQSILRSGSALPTKPGDIYRQELFKHRHAERAQSLGVSVMSHIPKQYQISKAGQYFMKFGNSGRRTQEKIIASGELEPPRVQVRQYIACDKEKEKDRFAHKMAFGKDPPPQNGNTLGPNIQGLSHEPVKVQRNNRSLLDERFAELMQEIEDRVDFLEQMSALGNKKTYQGHIVSQIQELVSQMKSISKERAEDYVECMELEKLDKSFSHGGYKNDKGNLFLGGQD